MVFLDRNSAVAPEKKQEYVGQVSKSEIQKTSLIWRHSGQAAEINTEH